jgi:Domain of unknown function (DUF4836)
MRNRFLYLLFLSGIVLAMSCNKAGKTGLLVPKDAAVVVHINMKSLSTKLTLDEIKQSAWYHKMSEEAHDSFARKIINDPDASGVDTKSDFVFFLKRQGFGGYSSFQGTVKDANAFAAFVKEASKGKAEIQKSGDLNYASTDGKGLITWTTSKFLFIGDTPMQGMHGMGDGANSGSVTHFSNDSLLIFAKSIYALSGKDLLDDNAKFADLIKSDGDLHFWVSTDNIYKGMANGMMNMMKLSALTEDNIGTATLNFDNGKITMTGKQYYGKELTKIIDKFPPANVSKDLINRLPSGDVIGALAFNYPSEGWVEIMKLIGADGLANMFLGQKGITLDDFSKALKGEIAFAVTDIQKQPKTVEYDNGDGTKSSSTTMKTEPNFVFALAIKDKPSFDKLFGLVNEEMMKDGPPPGIVIKNEKDWLVVSNNDANAASFLTGNNKPAYADKLSGHGFGGYLNIQKLISTFRNEMTRDSSAVAAMDLSMKTWQDAVSWGDYKSGAATFVIEVNFVDKTTNSLKQLNRYADQMTALHDEYQKKQVVLQDMEVDSTMAAPSK